MIHTKLAWIAAACLMGLASSGCATGGPSALTATVHRFPGVESSVVLDLAALALAEHGFEIDRQRSSADTVATYPMELSPHSDAPAVGSAFRGARRRSVATAHVRRSAGTATAYCRVEIQERSTDAARFHAAEHGLTDVPSDTPIDREGATTEEQNTVWRVVGRDKRRERAILEMIAAFLMSEAENDAPASPP
ncbi:MAG: hypothetical protein C4547_06670 [Phycisphaerales bacterium]|nr:MAG: hypothetical protein C4547_06670 [Phycisphaerales bacterium]